MPNFRKFTMNETDLMNKFKITQKCLPFYMELINLVRDRLGDIAKYDTNHNKKDPIFSDKIITSSIIQSINDISYFRPEIVKNNLELLKKNNMLIMQGTIVKLLQHQLFKDIHELQNHSNNTISWEIPYYDRLYSLFKFEHDVYMNLLK